jgi:hypothetical protein
VLVVTVAGLCAVAAPGTVRADGGTEPPSVDPSEIAAVPELEESVVAIVVDAVEGTTEDPDATTVVPDADPDDPGAEAGSSGDVPDAVEAALETGTETGTDDAEQPESTGDPASEDGSEPDTASDSGDTAPGSTGTAAPVAVTGGAAPHPAAPSAPATTAMPTGSANINVSVRIGSAGDTGAVTQTNIGATAPPSAASRNAASTPATSQDTGTGTTADSEPGSTWYWEWDCLGSPVLGPISPSGSNDGSIPQTWTWIWNCPSNSDRYHEETDPQYQQVNANVSIRISSPGNDGPVTQSNIAAAAIAELPGASLPSIRTIPGLASLPVITIPMPAISLPAISIAMPSIGGDVGGIAWSTTSPTPMMPSLVVAPAFSIGSDTPWVIDLGEAGLAIEAADEIVVGANAPVEAEALAPVGETAATPSPPEGRALPEEGHPPAAVEERASVAAPVMGSKTGSPELAAAVRRAHETDAPPRARPAPSWKPSAATSGRSAPSAAPSTATASAAGAGGSSGGGLPIFLALPFLAAVLDLARRVALERATWPSGHRRRIPDTPG